MSRLYSSQIESIIDDTLVPITDEESLEVLLSNIGNKLKEITGGTSWKDSPTYNIEELLDYIDTESINNQIASAQDADFWIDGEGKANTFSSNIDSYFNGVRIGQGAVQSQNNIVVGSTSSLNSISTGSSLTIIGHEAGLNLTTATASVGIGTNALRNATGGYGNIAVGLNTLYSITSGNSNIAIGVQALQSNTIGDNNIAFGGQVLFSNTSGSGNIGIGIFALQNNTTGSNNIVLSSTNGLAANISGSYSIAIGTSALISNSTGQGNIGVGLSALQYTTIGSNNVGIGNYALRNGTAGENNVGIGYFSGSANTVGTDFIAIGTSAGASGGTNQSYSVLIGYEAGRFNSAQYNIMIGYQSGIDTTAANNTFIGYRAGLTNTSGAYNTILGYYSLPSATQSNTLALADGQNNIKIYSPSSHNIILGGTTDNTLAKLQVYGAAYIDTIANATTDTDKFLVSDGGVIKYRTGTEILSDIGGVTNVRTITLTGTANQVLINGLTTAQTFDLSADRTWTFTLPQSIATTSSPTFTGLTTTGNVRVGGQSAYVYRDDDGFSSSPTRRAWATTANYDSFGMWSLKVANSAGVDPLASGTTVVAVTATQFTTFGATGSEAHIFGGSAKVNGALTVSGSGNSIVDVANTFAVSIGAASATPNFVAIGTSGSGVPQIQGYNNAFSAETPLALQPNGNRLLVGTITDDGVNKLQVNGGIINNDTFSWGTSGNKYMYGTGGTQKFAYTISQHNIVYSGGTTGFSIYDSTDTYYILRATDAGNVSVKGLLNTDSGTIFAKASGTEGSGYQLNAITMGYDSVNALGWITAGGASSRTSLLLNAGGGNVGIGLTSPYAKLDVNGVINSVSTSGYSLGSTTLIPNGVGGFYHSDGATTGYSFLYANLGGLRFGVEGNTNVLDFVKTTGAATFSSSVTVGSTFKVNNGADRFTISTAGVVEWNPAGIGGVLTWDTGKAIIAANSTNALSWVTNGTERVSIHGTTGEITAISTTNRTTFKSTSSGVSASIGINLKDASDVVRGYIVNASGGISIGAATAGLTLLGNDLEFLYSDGTDVTFQNFSGQIFTHFAPDTGEAFIMGSTLRVNGRFTGAAGATLSDDLIINNPFDVALDINQTTNDTNGTKSNILRMTHKTSELAGGSSVDGIYRGNEMLFRLNYTGTPNSGTYDLASIRTYADFLADNGSGDEPYGAQLSFFVNDKGYLATGTGGMVEVMRFYGDVGGVSLDFSDLTISHVCETNYPNNARYATLNGSSLTYKPVGTIHRTTVNNTNYNVDGGEELIVYISLTAPRTVTLPANPFGLFPSNSNNPRVYIIKDETGNAGTHNITIQVASSGTIDGASTKTISTNYGAIKVYYYGTSGVYQTLPA